MRGGFEADIAAPRHFDDTSPAMRGLIVSSPQ
jgi:hypothetical protein